MNLCHLPVGIVIEHILPLLNPNELAQLALSCRYFGSLCNYNILWQRKVTQDFEVFPSAYLDACINWKQLYARLDDALVFTWGENSDRRLGFNDQIHEEIGPLLRQINTPRELRSLRGKGITSMVAGGWSFHALDRRGRVWMWGWMQPSHPFVVIYSLDQTLVSQPMEVKLPPEVRIKQIASGRSHAVALDHDGHIWHWTNLWQPSRVCLALATCPVIQVSASWRNSVALTATGEIFVLPHPSTATSTSSLYPVTVVNTPPITIAHMPTRRFFATGDRFVQIACLEKHTMALSRYGRVFQLHTHTYNANNSTLVAIERADYGASAPEINEPPHRLQRSLSAQNHQWAVIHGSKILVGNENDDVDTPPQCIDLLDPHGVPRISLGDRHFGALTSNGTLMTWGEPHASGLGRGFTVAQDTSIPGPVEKLCNMFVFDISFGGQHSGCLAIPRFLDDMPPSRAPEKRSAPVQKHASQ